jgi:hypothetical protein
VVVRVVEDEDDLEDDDGGRGSVEANGEVGEVVAVPTCSKPDDSELSDIVGVGEVYSLAISDGDETLRVAAFGRTNLQ